MKKGNEYRLIDSVIAAVMMAATLSSLALIVAFWIIPWGCYTRADAMSSLWGCVVPGVTIISSIFLVITLPIGFLISRRVNVSILKRWYTLLLGSAVATQIAISSAGIIAATPMHAGLRYSDVVFVPHGFAVGFVCAALYWLIRVQVQKTRSDKN